jgi:NitT/TauT family transport system substrate-binding protein
MPVQKIENRLWPVSKTFGLAILTAFLTSCSVFPTRPIPQMKEVRVGYLPMVSSLTMFVATEKGYFTEKNIKVVPSLMESSNVLARELQKGSIDLAVELSIVPLLQASTREESPSYKIFSISQIKPKNGFDGILVKKNSTIKSLGDLSGKRIATFPGTTSPKSISHLFSKQYPNKPIPIFETDIRPGDQISALIRGEVDAVHAYEPRYTLGIVKYQMRDAGGSIYGQQTSPNPNPIGVAALNSRFLAKDPTTANRLIEAINKAVIYIREAEVDSRRILAKYTKIDQEMASQMRILPMTTSDEMDINNLQNYLDFLRSINENNSSFKANQMVYKPSL